MKVEVTHKNYEDEVLRSEIPVLVDFYADWCEPCKQMSAVLEEVEKEYEGKVKLCCVNVEEERELAKGFKIESIPTVLYYKNGYVITGGIGYAPKDRVVEMIADDMV